MEGYEALVDCEGDSRNVVGGQEAKKTSSWFSKHKISRKERDPDTAQGTGTQGIKNVAEKREDWFTSGIGRIWTKQRDKVMTPSSRRSDLQTAADDIGGTTTRNVQISGKQISGSSLLDVSMNLEETLLLKPAMDSVPCYNSMSHMD
jgi:hypothetical protein